MRSNTRGPGHEPPGSHPTEPDKGQGFMDAPRWWLLWIVISIAAVYLPGKLESF